VYIPKYKLCFEFQVREEIEEGGEKRDKDKRRAIRNEKKHYFLTFFHYRIIIIILILGILNIHRMTLKKLIISL
jgi:hypothetical protein